ncbi:MAG: UDP-N-acetylmuramate--L-alanine ligase [Prevotellaceae bacterium]|jgi:UDP-N-acetylmuramate--alanine ligase|nr:UDP-N-acetylmuramate--L-alanine ligase [Prevotellaceae bacterium]
MNNVYLIGIGGIGMSALARYYKHEGYAVAGYDRVASPLAKQLEAEGISIHYTDDVTLIPNQYKSGIDNVLVIYTPAVPSDHSELQYYRNNGYKVIKRSAVLGLIARGKYTLAIAGTHGKTTTSTLLAHLLTAAGNGCTAFLGGISKNYHTNLLLSKSDYLVAEADEFDRSFLQLFPQAAIITSADADHLDIYGTDEEIKKAFAEFASQIKPNGLLAIKQGVNIKPPSNGQTIYRYSYNNPCDFYADNIRPIGNGHFTFDIYTPNSIIKECTLGIPGWINIENAVAATALALSVGTDENKLKDALASFAGVERRFDVRLNTPTLTYIDDYAHHPEEIKAALSSIQQMFPKRKLTVAFQPHLYTRTRDFYKEFAESLNVADEIILLDIYPARELPIEGITSHIIYDNIINNNKTLCKREELTDIIENKKDIDILVTLGAGDIDRFVAPITDILKERLEK